jgi:hypothetical protein
MAVSITRLLKMKKASDLTLSFDNAPINIGTVVATM